LVAEPPTGSSHDRSGQQLEDEPMKPASVSAWGPNGTGVTVGESLEHERTTVTRREDEPRERTTIVRKEREEPDHKVIIRERDRD